MKDYLLDLVKHSHDLGCFDLIKIEGTDQETKITALGAEQSVVLTGKFHNPVADFIGTFGMPNLNKLKIILGLEEYREGATMTKTYNAQNELDGIEFKNATGDFKNNYRFMVANVVTSKLKTPKFAGANWHIKFEPSVASVQRLKWQAAANAEEPFFQVRTDGNDLRFSFGDHSSHAGSFVFQPDVGGTLKRAWHYPVSNFINILNLSGDKIVQMSDDGAAQITVDSGLGLYTYILPAQSK